MSRCGIPHHNVLDATTGQNGLTQARLFTESAHVTGIALTKLDGTAKGGIVPAFATDLGLPSSTPKPARNSKTSSPSTRILHRLT